MNYGKYVFAQVVVFLPARLFDRCVARYDGNKWVKHFTCWNQLMCMMFGQLSGRESLRDLIITVGAHTSKFYHLGFGKNVSRSNLANANEQRDCQIYKSFAYEMISVAKLCLIGESDFALAIKGNVYAFDSTTIDLCLNVFWWASFRSTKGAIKIHILFDVKTAIPTFIHSTEGSVHDVNDLDVLCYEAGAYYVVDKAYVDFRRLFISQESNAFFVSRAKDNLNCQRVGSIKADKSKGIVCDHTIKLSGHKSAQLYPANLR
jgi:hypothetical protein